MSYFRYFFIMFLLFIPLVSSATLETEILYYINEYRIAHHRAPLRLDSTLSKTAKHHSEDMATHKIPFGHQYFKQRMDYLHKAVTETEGGGENVAYYKINPKELVQRWIESRGHRANILRDFNLTGIGIAPAKKGWAYFTQLFVKTKPLA